MRKCYCTLLLSEIDNILDPKQAVSLQVPREFDFRKNACACMHYIDCKSNIYILLHRIIFYDFQSEKLQGKNEREAIMQNTFHVVKVDQVLRKENAVAAANAV